MSLPLISVLHPTRRVAPSEGFPSGWLSAFWEWISAADNPEQIEYVVSVHESRWEQFWRIAPFSAVPLHMALESSKVTVQYGALHSVLVVKHTGQDANIANLNNAAAHCSGQLIIGTMDDIGAPEHWDTLLLAAIDDVDVYGVKPMEAEVFIHCSTGPHWSAIGNSSTRVR